MDSLTDLDSPPSSVLSAINNRWLSTRIKETVSCCYWITFQFLYFPQIFFQKMNGWYITSFLLKLKLQFFLSIFLDLKQNHVHLVDFYFYFNYFGRLIVRVYLAIIKLSINSFLLNLSKFWSKKRHFFSFRHYLQLYGQLSKARKECFK